MLALPRDPKVKYLIYALVTTSIVAWTSVLLNQAKPNHILLLFFFTLLAEAFPIQIPAIRGSVSLSFIPIYVTIMSQGVWPGVVVATLGTVRPADFAGMPVRAVVFNRIQLGAAAAASGIVFHWLVKGESITDPWVVFSFAVAAAVYFATNIGLSILYLKQFSQASLGKLVHQFKSTVALNYLALMPLAYLIAVIEERVGLFGVLLFMLPLVVARFSFQRYVDIHQMFLGTIRALALALEAKDRYTYGHADRVARLAVNIGRQLNLNDIELEQLQYAGILHDIGKIGVRDEILNKPGKYSPEEYEEMKKRPVIGARIVSGVNSLETVAYWIRHHHERYDGTGYPDGLKGEEIPLGSRIIAVADAFDAMLYDRPYKAGRPLPEVIDELKRCSGTHFDPKIVDVLLDLISNPERVADLTRPPELQFIQYLATLYGWVPRSPRDYVDDVAVAAEEPLLVVDDDASHDAYVPRQ
ncbi:HD-GYP domain-containing protein [Thermaerobacter subterraneus]|uniref:HD-GYP domain-containing protein n=1 Tax=Thermaerobacter subterraneus DSM 13965 TaxID=867903 RepID=K6P0J9_9FIRM|nr:HD-GYP domain-containing protein [Thermaerobacter subterraneus]EKP94630.1 HD-GYP domain-containing protein [Thermaerobacter subterraneus DSM 13965]